MAHDIVVNGTTYPGVVVLKMVGANGEEVAFYPDAVRYNPQALTDEQKAQARENMYAEEGAPQYVNTEANNVVKKLLAVQTENTIIFAAIADCHVAASGDKAKYSQIAVKRAGEAIQNVSQQMCIDFVVNLGDNIWDREDTVEEAEKEHRLLNQAIGSAFARLPQFRLIGNHDANKPDACIPTNHLYALNGKFNTYDDCGITPVRGYGYLDLPKHKVRVIALNTSDYIDSKGGFFLSDEQKTWFMAALDLSEKEDSGEWHILIISHIPLDAEHDTGGETALDTMAILQAYQDGSTVSIGAGTYDYSGKNNAMIICNIHGHLHNFGYGTMPDGKTVKVSTPATSFYLSDVNNPQYNKIADTAQDTTVTFYSIDLFNKTIHSINYGAGFDRQIQYIPWEYAITDLSGMLRGYLLYEKSTHKITNNNDNYRMTLMVTTENDGGSFVSRESKTLYMMPVPEKASRVTVETEDELTKKVYMNAFKKTGDESYNMIFSVGETAADYTIVFDVVESNKWSAPFERGSCEYLNITLMASSETGVYPWGYDIPGKIRVSFS